MGFPLDRRSFLTSLAAASMAGSAQAAEGDWQWRYYGSDPGASRYAPIDQINQSNVKDLQVAWVHKTGDSSARPQTTNECTPIVVDGVMYLQTPRLKTQALDAKTGKLLWTFDPAGGQRGRRPPGQSRGVSYWQSEDGEQKRIFAPVRDTLYGIDAETGKLDPDFAEAGALDLNKNFDHDMEGLSTNLTSPVVIYEDIMIVGGGGGEGPQRAAPGHIRGYDVRSGTLRWLFRTVPRPGQFGYETWPEDAWTRVGGTNNWAGMSLDAKRGWVFVSTGSPAFDYWGGDRKGQNLFGNCVIALDAKTGERKWHYQVVHHDIWDYDLPAQPALITMQHEGRTIDAVAQVTKQSFIFFLDRDTGKPIFPVEERKMKPSAIPGEELWPTQPYPTKPPPLSRIEIPREDVSDIDPETKKEMEALWDRTDGRQLYDPSTFDGTFIHPGFRGGILWGGCSFDPERNRIFVNSEENTNRITIARADTGEPFEYKLSERWKVRDKKGYPIVKPPWAHMTAVDLDSGEFAWRVVSGEYEELTERGIPKTGTPSHGGSIATKGGLVFFAGTFDRKIRAYNSDSGEILWEHRLNAGGFATPATYQVDGKQYLVISAGGGKGDSPSGDEIVAFSL